MFDFLGSRTEFTSEDAARLRRVEKMLSLILTHLNIPYEDGDGEITDKSKSLALSGDKIGAIKEYRMATGAGLAEAKRAVEDYIRRQDQKIS